MNMLYNKTMRKIIAVLLLSIYINMFMGGYLSAQTSDLDDLERSFKEMERSMKQDSLKDMPLGKDYQLSPQEIKPLNLEIPKDKPATDKAIIRNQQRLQELIDGEKKVQTQDAGGWFSKIPKKYRFIVEIFAVGLFISFFSLLVYKQRVKKQEEERFPEEKEEGPDDGITFYGTGKSSKKDRPY